MRVTDFSPETLDVSIAVCTRTRAGPIANLLDSITRLRIPPGITWEVVVVDNGSSDDTRQAILAYADRLPIHYAFEETPGVANARNHAVRVLQGRHICWTDDDAEVDPEWLCAYVDAFRRYPDAALFGGKVSPVLQPPTPPWFARLVDKYPVDALVASRDFGGREIPLDISRDHIPWGVNHAVRTSDQRRFPYDPQLGVSPLMRRSGEESQMMFELMTSGVTGWWIPSAHVRHIYPSNRQSLAYFYKHYAAIGETMAHLDDTRLRHLMNQDGLQKRFVYQPMPLLSAHVVIDGALFAGFRSIGLTQRSLYHLRKMALYAGIVAFKRQGMTGAQKGARHTRPARW
jgi:glycosyltransferase involved in cell wall biosynthesis